jgi:catechol 2,3-dioxygenase-like lactoylglutathione lyase family enzyme
MAANVHHTSLVTADMEATLRFWCEGLGFNVLVDTEVEGDWPELFGAPSRRLRHAGLDGTLRQVTTNGVRVAVVRDPNGVLIELMEPAPQAVDHASEIGTT